MTADPADRNEDRLAELLAGCDDALAAGAPPSSLEINGTPGDQRPRLERDLECVQLLRAVLENPRGRLPAPAAPHGAPTVPAESPLRIGRFEIRRELGQGGFGVVFLAFDPQLGREVALKIPRAEAFLTAELRSRFQYEARIAAGLDHPHIVPVYDAGEVGPVCYIASAYCPGLTLAEWLRQRDRPVPFDIAAELVATMAEAVQHAHSRGVLHRDLKPGNIILSPRGEAGLSGSGGRSGMEFVPRLTDFGLAKLVDLPQTDQTRTQAVLGTPEYMAPEQAAGRSRHATTAVDIYALGVILYELLTGRPPFRGESSLQTLRLVESAEPAPPHQLRAGGVPRDLATICLKSLEKSPAQRYLSAHMLAEDLQRFLAGEPVQARPIGRVERIVRWMRRNPGLAAASALAATGIAAALVIAVWFAVAQTDSNEKLRRQRRVADERRQEAERRLALNYLERGVALCQKADVARGLVLMNQAFQTAPDEDAALCLGVRRAMGAWVSSSAPLATVIDNAGSGVSAAAFMPDGRGILIGDYGGRVRLYDAETGRPLLLQFRHERMVRSIAVAPDGQTIVSASADQTARVWDAGTGEQRFVLPHDGAVVVVAFSPDGGRVLTAAHDGRIRLWDAATGELAFDLMNQGDDYGAAALSPRGDLIATGNFQGMTRLWNAATGELVGPPLRDTGAVIALRFSPDGRLVAVGTRDRITVWNVETFGVAYHILSAGNRGGVPMAFSPDGEMLLTAHDNAACLWRGRTGRKLATFPCRSAVLTIGFHHSGERLVVGGSDGTARIWRPAPAEPNFIDIRHGAEAQAVAFSPDGRLIATGSHDRTARISEAGTGASLRDLPHPAEVIGIRFNADSSRLATQCRNGEVRIWNAGDGTLAAGPLPHDARFGTLAFSPAGTTLLTGGYDGTIRFWNAADGKPDAMVLTHGAEVSVADFSATGAKLVTGSHDGTVQLWDLRQGQAIGAIPERHGQLLFISFSRDGTLFLTCHENGREARLWTTSDCRLISSFAHQGRVTRAAWHPDGKSVVTASFDGTAREWSLETGKPLGHPLQHADLVHDVAFSPDGGIIMTGCQDKTAQFWERTTGQPLGPALPAGGGVWSVAFSPDGRTALTGAMSPGTSARLWRVPVPLDRQTRDDVATWTRSLTGMRLDSGDAFDFLDAGEWQSLRRD